MINLNPTYPTLQFIHLVHQIDRITVRRTNKALIAASGITYSQFIILVTIEKLGVCTQSEVSTYLSQHSAAIKRPLYACVEAGLIGKVQNSYFRIYNDLMLTDSGEHMMPLLKQVVHDALARSYRSKFTPSCQLKSCTKSIADCYNPLVPR